MVNIDKNKLAGLEVRLHRLKNNGRNFDSPGVVRKLERQIRHIKEHMGKE